jgi:hypothetical protein
VLNVLLLSFINENKMQGGGSAGIPQPDPTVFARPGAVTGTFSAQKAKRQQRPAVDEQSEDVDFEEEVEESQQDAFYSSPHKPRQRQRRDVDVTPAPTPGQVPAPSPSASVQRSRRKAAAGAVAPPSPQVQQIPPSPAQAPASQARTRSRPQQMPSSPAVTQQPAPSPARLWPWQQQPPPPQVPQVQVPPPHVPQVQVPQVPQVQPPPPAVAPATGPAAEAAAEEERIVRDFAGAINDVLEQSLTVMLDAVSAVAYKLGEQDVRRVLLWRPTDKNAPENPLAYLRIIDESDPDLKTVDYFIRTYSPKLGVLFIQTFLESWLQEQKEETEKLVASLTAPPTAGAELIGSNGCFDFESEIMNPRDFGNRLLTSSRVTKQLQDLLQGIDPASEDAKKIRLQYVRNKAAKDTVKLLRLKKPEIQFAPAWAFDVISSNVFREFVKPAHLVAFELALSQVNRIRGCETFTMKELICSKGVMDQFAWMVAYQYMDASKGLPMHHPKHQQGERGIYVNINHMRETVQKRAYLCRIWFESVRAMPNPMLQQFAMHKEKERERQRLLGNLGDQLKVDLFEAHMQRLYEMLPKRELKYVGN